MRSSPKSVMYNASNHRKRSCVYFQVEILLMEIWGVYKSVIGKPAVAEHSFKLNDTVRPWHVCELWVGDHDPGNRYSIAADHHGADGEIVVIETYGPVKSSDVQTKSTVL